MQIRPEEIEYKREVGSLNGAPVLEVGLKGGWHMVFAVKPGGKRGQRLEPIGVGSHPGLARFIAKKKHPDVKYTDLAKSAPVDARTLEALAPRWEEVTARLRARLGY